MTAFPIIKRLANLLDVLISSPQNDQVLTYETATQSWKNKTPTGGGGGAPTTADYLVATAQAGLSAEIVVGATPGGELGGTWAAPTVDASHSGSTHAAVQAAAEATAAAADAAHVAAADPHAQYQRESEKGAAGGYAALDGSATVPDAQIAATITRDSELAAHEADTTAIHGIADTSALALSANHPTNATFNAHAARHVDGGADEITTALDPRAYPLLADTLALRPGFGVVGRFFWTTDEGILYRDSGTAWIKVAVNDYADLDDIPATFAPSAHAHAGDDITSGTVADARIAASIARDSEVVLQTLADAKGDIVAASGVDAWSRLPVGVNGQVLTADSAESLGVKWAAAAGGTGGAGARLALYIYAK